MSLYFLFLIVSFSISLSLLEIVFFLYSNISNFLLSHFSYIHLLSLWGSENNLWEQVIFFHCVSLGVELRSTCLAASISLPLLTFETSLSLLLVP